MYYRLYRFQNGRVEQGADIACEGDVEAMQIAEKVFDGRAAELWLGTRKVASWPSVARADSALAGVAARGSTRADLRA